MQREPYILLTSTTFLLFSILWHPGRGTRLHWPSQTSPVGCRPTTSNLVSTILHCFLPALESPAALCKASPSLLTGPRLLLNGAPGVFVCLKTARAATTACAHLSSSNHCPWKASLSLEPLQLCQKTSTKILEAEHLQFHKFPFSWWPQAQTSTKTRYSFMCNLHTRSTKTHKVNVRLTTRGPSPVAHYSCMVMEHVHKSTCASRAS